MAKLLLWSLVALSTSAALLQSILHPLHDLALSRRGVPDIVPAVEPKPIEPTTESGGTPSTESGGTSDPETGGTSDSDPLCPGCAHTIPHPAVAPIGSTESENEEAIEELLDNIKDIIENVLDAISQSSSSSSSPGSNCTVPLPFYSQYQNFTNSCNDITGLSCPIATNTSSFNGTWSKCQTASVKKRSADLTSCQNDIVTACNNVRSWASGQCNLDVSSIPSCETRATATNGTSSASSSATPTIPPSTGRASVLQSGTGTWTLWIAVLLGVSKFL